MRNTAAFIPCVLAVAGCAGPPGDASVGPGAEAEEVFEAPAITNPQIDFSPRPSYLPARTIVLTFDDGPDSTNTAKVLDILKSHDVKATFFINSRNFTDLGTDPDAQALVRRIVNEGHELGNHTARHLDLSTLSEADIEQEISEVEQAVRTFVSPSRRLTLLRAPFGVPYDPNGDTSGFDRVAPIVARHAVHIGWAITPQDFACADASCVFEGVRNALEDGSFGIVLLHSTLAQTVGALPDIIDFARSNGFTFKQAEDVVRARFGLSSGQIIDGQGGGGGGGGDDGTVARTAVADAHVRDGSFAGTNFGGATALQVKQSTVGFNRVAYLKFDLSGIASVRSATLRIAGRSGGAAVGFQVRPVASTSWSESEITFDNRPEVGAAVLASGSVSGTTVSRQDLDLTTHLRSERAADHTIVSLALVPAAASSAIASFIAREASANRPQLIITP